MAHAIMVKHFKHSSCFHMRFNINKSCSNRLPLKPNRERIVETYNILSAKPSMCIDFGGRQPALAFGMLETPSLGPRCPWTSISARSPPEPQLSRRQAAGAGENGPYRCLKILDDKGTPKGNHLGTPIWAWSHIQRPKKGQKVGFGQECVTRVVKVL